MRGWGAVKSKPKHLVGFPPLAVLPQGAVPWCEHREDTMTLTRSDYERMLAVAIERFPP